MSTQKFDFPTRIAFYDTIIERLEEITFALTNLRFALRKITGRHVLDVGVGEFPAFWYMLNQCGVDAVGTDILPQYFPESLGSLKTCLFQDDITKTRIKPDSFDVVTCISTLEHIPDWQAAVINMRRLCRNGGRIIITVPFSRNYPADNIKGGNKLTRIFSSAQISEMEGLAGPMTSAEYWKCWSGAAWRQGERLGMPESDRVNPDLIGVCFEVMK
jgi:ubiquinone/menaquinone biosynthesis C-methylase UbiE